jgi:hypothetical protein
LEFFPPGIGFVLQAIAIRTVHATANAFVIVSTFAYIALEFPHRVARIFVSCFLYHHQLLHLGFSWRSILQFKLIKSLLLSSKIYSDIFIAGIIYECYLLSSFQASKPLFFFFFNQTPILGQSLGTHRLQIWMCVKNCRIWDRAIFQTARGLYHLEKTYWNQPHSCLH